MRINTHIVPAASTLALGEVTTENLAASRCRIGDPEVAAAMVDFACSQIRRRRASAAPAGTDAAPRMVLRLLE